MERILLHRLVRHHLAIQNASPSAINRRSRFPSLFVLSDAVRKGFNKVTVHMQVKSEATPEELTELALFSSVYDIASKSLAVQLKLVTS